MLYHTADPMENGERWNKIGTIFDELYPDSSTLSEFERLGSQATSSQKLEIKLLPDYYPSGRNLVKRYQINGCQDVLVKEYLSGRESFETEKCAYDLLSQHPQVAAQIDTGDNLLVLEFLCEATQLSSLKVEPNHLEAVLEFMDSLGEMSPESKFDLPEECPVGQAIKQVTEEFNSLANLIPYFDDRAGVQDSFEKLAAKLRDVPVRIQLIHGDLALENLLWRDRQIYFVDLEMVKVSDPACDIARLAKSLVERSEPEQVAKLVNLCALRWGDESFAERLRFWLFVRTINGGNHFLQRDNIEAVTSHAKLAELVINAEDYLERL